MIEVKILASSSAGNCAWISDGETPLLLDCGIPIKKIKEGLKFKLHEVAACMVTHEHGDHAKAVHDLMSAGIDIYASRGTAWPLIGESSCPRMKFLQDKECIQVGTWRAMAFKVEHDSAEPLGFLLQSGSEKVLFVADTAFLRYKFDGLTHIIIECNYDTESLKRNLAAGTIDKGRYDRVIETHFGLETLVAFLAANDLSGAKEIFLCHLSDGNSNEYLMRSTIEKQFGIPVYVAKR